MLWREQIGSAFFQSNHNNLLPTAKCRSRRGQLLSVTSHHVRCTKQWMTLAMPYTLLRGVSMGLLAQSRRT